MGQAVSKISGVFPTLLSKQDPGSAGLIPTPIGYGGRIGQKRREGGHEAAIRNTEATWPLG